MRIKNIDKINESLNKFVGEEYKHYFIVERPEWDSQFVYYDVHYNVESDNMHGGYIEVCSMIYDEELDDYILEIKNKFNLPVYEWEKVMVDYNSR